jgi:RimJ/RimL family protein N-acetyltransferase
MLIGEHIGLRAIERDDLRQLMDWRNRPDFRRHFREHREIGMESQQAWFERMSADLATLMFAIVDRGDGRLLGASGLCFIDWVNRNCDLSLYIGDDGVYIDDRYAPDAARTTLAYAFGELGMHRIWVEIYDFDTPKQKLLEVLGFQLEGRHREHHFAEGRYHDSLFYGLLAADWQAAQGG